LTTATFALIPGFLAIALVGGLLKPFAIIAAGAILVSSVLALTLVPRTVVGVRGQGSGVWLDRITDRYHDALAWGLDHRGLVGTLVLATLLVPGLLAGGRSRETGERAGVVLAIQGPDATTLRGVTRRVADQLRLLPGAAGMVLITRSGTAGPPAGDPVVTIQLRFAGRAPQPAELRASLDSVPLPPGYRILRSGISATGPGLWLAVGAAVLVLYLVLVLRFGSFRDPLGILAALALAPLGGVAALLLTRNGLSLSGVVGLLLVLGLALRHSTLLLTCARRRHAKGASLRVALIDAARLRLRPVLLSTVTLALASVPLALLGGATLGPFASAALGGLLTTLPTTLLVTPVGYEVLARRQGGQPALDLG
jgi:multidrug efflux pump subunit AcrB